MRVKKGYKYLKLEVQGDDMNTNYVLSIYSNSSKTNRVQLAQSLNGKTLLYHQIKEDDQYIYCKLEWDIVEVVSSYYIFRLNRIIRR